MIIYAGTLAPLYGTVHVRHTVLSDKLLRHLPPVFLINAGLQAVVILAEYACLQAKEQIMELETSLHSVFAK